MELVINISTSLPVQQVLMYTPTEDGQPLYLPARQENKVSRTISETVDNLLR